MLNKYNYKVYGASLWENQVEKLILVFEHWWYIILCQPRQFEWENCSKFYNYITIPYAVKTLEKITVSFEQVHSEIVQKW